MVTVSDPRTSELAAARYALAGHYDPTPDTVRAEDFEKWPVSVQAAFVRSFAGGAGPASILVGKESETQMIATLSAGGGDVAITRAPTDFNLAPGRLSVSTFLTWANEAQVFYARINGSGLPTAVTIGSAGAMVTATVTRDAFGNAAGLTLTSSAEVTAANAATLAKLPVNLSPQEFFDLLPDEQAAYIRANGRIDPKDPTRTPTLALAGAGADGTPIVLTSRGSRFVVLVPAGTYRDFDTPFTGQTSPVRESTFTRWPREVQRAYVEAQPGDYPKTVVLAGNGPIAFIGAQGGDVDTFARPGDFGATPEASSFLNWPLAAQIAHARRNAENPAAVQSLVLRGENGQSLAIALAPAPAGITLASAPVPGLPPTALDLDLFQLWPTADQVAYLAARGSGTPQALVLGPDQGLLTLGAGGVPRIDPFPTAFRTGPAALAPATFLTWSPAFQALYLDHRGTTQAGTRSVTIGDPAGLSLAVSATVTGTGLGAIRVTSGLLRIDASKAMTLQAAKAILAPLDSIYGSAGQTLERNRADALAVFPVLTSLTAADFPDEPAGTVDTKAVEDQLKKAPSELTVQQFQAWNPATQRAYLLGRVPTPTTLPISNPAPLNPASGGSILMRSLEIGSGDAKITVFCTGEPAGKVYTAEGITPADAVQMSNDDRYALAGFLTKEQFGQWHTAAQIAYLKRSGDGTKGNSAAIGTGTDKITAFLGADGTKVYTVETLQKTDIARMTLADQTVLAGLTAFTNGVAQTTGLSADKTAANLIVSRLESAIRSPSSDTKSTSYLKGGNSSMPQDDKNVFLGELALLKAKIDNGAVFSLTDITAQVEEIKTRFERLNCFAVNVFGPEKDTNLYGWAGLESGYKAFLDQEKRLLNLAQNRQALATDTASGKLDVPNLVYLFQLYANLAGEAKIRADTEEINQTNELLKIYGKAQNRANEVLKLFDPKKTDEQKSLDDVRKSTGPWTSPLYQEDQDIIKYFASSIVASPIEKMANLTRPTGGFGAATSSGWSTFNNQLTDYVALLNQQSQIKMNEVNSQTKAKDRNFDLANNALSKMNEIVQKIAST